MMTEDYRKEIIEAAQIAGARASRDCFFPRWRVNKLFANGYIAVECTGNKEYVVTVTDPASQRSSGVSVSVPNARIS